MNLAGTDSAKPAVQFSFLTKSQRMARGQQTELLPHIAKLITIRLLLLQATAYFAAVSHAVGLSVLPCLIAEQFKAVVLTGEQSASRRCL
jgi:hypothetical protein